ncbi:hypothetical protein Pla108_41280 [Botrimarina colliarenosi]|uniref:Uncharacterized protein n=1 Tax=Botrimarina colliarenosi TaxID=2528001 RepID=A0A5C5ZYF2_9BACT|nr:hypothetical protein [Botrimarina colliarenosi]TWT92329.1 hypothetical protein Pla108_41280 [Botrimarina colliarenosi]
MKKLIALCIVTTVVSSTTGCGCCRRLRDFVCRGAQCGGSALAAPAPMAYAPPPMAVAPMAYDPGCSYAGYDPGCNYSVGYGGPSYDSGWSPGAAGCESCSGGYAMPSDGGYLVDPNASSSMPGPQPLNGN